MVLNDGPWFAFNIFGAIMIRYVRQDKIDKEKWDHCIGHSTNRLVYAQSWYLDMVASGWDALVEDDYASVMPLPAKQKYGIPYLIQPRFTQQLGIFSTANINEQKVLEFLSDIPAKFVWSHLYLNSANPVHPNTRITARTNFEINLRHDYSDIYLRYNENARRNLKKALSAGLTVANSYNAAAFTYLYQQHAKIKPNDTALEQLESIVAHALQNNLGEIILVRNLGDKIIAGAFYLTAWNRIIYHSSFNTTDGQQSSAMFYAMDEMIRRHAGTATIFDFEGSMIPGIARFFEGFGGQKKFYFQFKKVLWL
jgi:hypothetical protein